MSREVAGSSPALRSVPIPKLYAIGRADLSPGLRAAQIGHALIAWALQHGETCDNLVLLQARDEAALKELADRLTAEGVPFVSFSEPDLDGQVTALTARPRGWRTLSSLPLFR